MLFKKRKLSDCEKNRKTGGDLMKQKISKEETARMKLERAKFISVSDVLALIGPVVTDRTLQNGIVSGDVPGCRIGKRLLVSSEWVKNSLLKPINTTSDR